MKRIISFAFLFERDRGSEYEIGYEILKYNFEKSLWIFLPEFAFLKIPETSRRIKGLEVKRLSNKIIVNTRIVKREPIKPLAIRFFYSIWLFFCFFKYRGLNGVYWFVNLVQVAALNPFFIFEPKKMVVGPVGGQVKLYKGRLFTLWHRLKNLIITEFIYQIAPINAIKKSTVLFIHKNLQAQFTIQNSLVLPAMTVPLLQRKKISMSEKKNVVFYAKDTPIKLPNLGRSLMKQLSLLFPEYSFFVLGSNQEIVECNYYEYKRVPQKEFINILCNSRLHIFLSQELAGFVKLEASSLGCPSFFLTLLGIDTTFQLVSDQFALKVKLAEKVTVKDQLINAISDIICDDQLLSAEAIYQFESISNYTFSNKENILKRLFLEI